MNNLLQAIITIGNCVYLWFITHPNNGRKRTGFKIMLVVQIPYMITAYLHNQWGIFFAALLFAGYAVRGLLTHKTQPEGGET